MQHKICLMSEVILLDLPLGKQRHCEDKIAAMLQEGVKPHEETTMPMVAFPIPSLPPSMLSCRCMRMSYVLRVSLCSLFYTDLSAI